MLRYLGLLTLCDITFVVFLISWFVSRQICLFLVIRSLYLDGPRFIPFRWAPSEGRFFTQSTYYGFIAALCVLYVLATMWFYMACMVAIRVLRGMGAEDSRSDDEDEGESPLEDVPEVSSTAGHITRSGELTPSDGEVRKRR
jgi:acyl-CoA-dependent ceramide synthase